MTRINLVDPQYLTDEHLMAEYRELPRIFTAVLKAQEAGKKPSDYSIPEKYKLGKGHVTFFYDKCDWLLCRYNSLVNELLHRGFNLDSNIYSSVISEAVLGIRSSWFSDYSPTPEEVYINMYRLSVRHFRTDDVLFEGA